MIGVHITDFDDWRNTARKLLSAGIPPDQITWNGGLFSDRSPPEGSEKTTSVPREFLDSAQIVALHGDDTRWALLYRVLYRLTHGERNLLKIDIDDDVHQLRLMQKAVSRDMHKMKAFVRFRRIAESEPEQYVAWHRPDHRILHALAPWFAQRFGNMRWSILTPEESVHWDTEHLTYGPGIPHSQAPSEDDLEDLWREYYAAVFNPARVKVKAMKAEMPVRHWATLPEAQIIPDLLAKADGRVLEMTKTQKTSAAPFIPDTHDLAELRAAAHGCRGCDLYQHATQVVFGAGPRDSKVVMVGEQPGDEEDRRGEPFVGPSGRLLSKAMHEAGLDREKIYVTNAVKHFKFVERGKRRIHSKPG
ncbi:MAG TPA: TIGR03915 family putative DNA repair protein, partial [Bryobacteraceae bacterium]|nr:TIGR03915 family putative DNA repair protein [Bryobacteraceae bacterium]